MNWCNSEKLYGQGTEHGLVRHYPVNDGRDQLVCYKPTKFDQIVEAIFYKIYFKHFSLM